MSYTLPWTVNKLVSTNINNANSVTGTYTSVSLKVGGKTELSDATTIASLGVGKNTSSSYAVDVSGNINASSDISSGGNITAKKLGINKAVSSSYTVDVSGNINASSDISTSGNFTATGGVLASSSSITTLASTSITISNYNFATPSQSLNNYTTISSPYTAITGWTFSLISGTAPTVYIGRGFTSYVNTYETLFPEYPLFIQYLSVQGASIYQLNLTQSLTFASTGNYILTMYGWGMYNQYNLSNNISVSCGNNSITNFTLVEGLWTKIVMKFQITSAGSNTLTISLNNTTGASSGLSISGFVITNQNGSIVSDGTNTNNQLITSKGIYSTGFIYNKGSIQNFGTLQNYGPLSIILPYSPSSVVIGTSSFASSNSSDTGKYNVIIGESNITYSPSVAVNIDSCVFIGFQAGEQSQNSSRVNAIGYQAMRWATTNTCNDNVAYGYSAGSALGYQGGINCYQNTIIGNYVLSGAYTSGCFSNSVIGYGSLNGTSFSNPRAYNSICGANSLQNIVSNYNSSLGYNNANSIANTSSNYNTFVGALVCPTQSGSTNVLLNCSFFGSASDVASAGSYSNSTCLGYNSRITGNNQIILGTANETTFAMGGLNIPASKVLTILGTMIANSLSITPTQLGYLNPLTAGIVSLADAQTIAGIKTFSSPPVMSGASITASTIPSTAINNTTFVTLTGAQTVAGVKTFSSAPVMSGASITASTIPSTAINNTTFVTLTGAQTVAGVKTFSSPPIMDGTSINAATIQDSALSSNVDLLNGTQTFTGAKTFTGGIDGSATQTITFGLNAPTMSGANIAGHSIQPASLNYIYIDTSLTTNNSSFGSALSGGNENTFVGVGIGNATGSTGNDNTGCGFDAFFSLLTGSNNSAYGSNSLVSVNSGSGNCAYGSSSGYYITTGTNNTLIGYSAGSSNTNPTGCSALGASTVLNSGVNYSTAIGYGTVCDASNQIRLGRSTEVTVCSGGLNIPVSTVLTLLGNISANSLTVTPTQLGFLNNVTSGALPSANISNTSFVDLTNTQTVAGIKTFSSPPVMSGASISSATISDGALSSNIPLKNGANTFTGLNAVNNQYVHKAYGSLISAASTLTTLSSIIYEYYSVSAAATAFTITLPVVNSTNVGQSITFRRVGGTTTTVVSFTVDGTQLVYNTQLTGVTTAALMGSGIYIVKLVGLLVTGTTYAYFQI
jgi:hypothetical protein